MTASFGSWSPGGVVFDCDGPPQADLPGNWILSTLDDDGLRDWVARWPVQARVG